MFKNWKNTRYIRAILLGMLCFIVMCLAELWLNRTLWIQYALNIASERFYEEGLQLNMQYCSPFEPGFYVSFCNVSIHQPKRPFLFRSKKLQVRLSPRLLLTGQFKPQDFSFEQSVLDLDAIKYAQEHKIRSRSRATLQATSTPSSQVFKVWFKSLEITSHEFGSFNIASLSAQAHAAQIHVESVLKRGGQISFHVDNKNDPFNVQWHNVSIGELPAFFVAKIPIWIDGESSGSALIQWQRDAVYVQLTSTQQRISVYHPKLSTTTITPLTLSCDVEFDYQFTKKHLNLSHVSLGFGNHDDLICDIKGNIDFDLKKSSSLNIDFHSHDMHVFLKELPSALSLNEAAEAFEDDFEAHFEFDGFLHKPTTWNLEANFQINAKPLTYRHQNILKPFTYYATTNEQTEKPVLLDMSNPLFIPLRALPAYVIRSVLVSEDGRFFGHEGFDFEELMNSAAAVYEAGAPVRGGSTISQQLVKNLFLSKHKTITRKIQEALLTLALEKTVPKKRILEIYLNMIEWGPDIRGIGAASYYYYNKPATQLSISESICLATIIPNPKKLGHYCTRTGISPYWQKRTLGLEYKMFGPPKNEDEEITESESTSTQIENVPITPLDDDSSK